MSLAISAKKVPIEVLLPSEEELEDIHAQKNNEKDMSRQEALMELEDKAWEDAMILVFAVMEQILSGRR